MEQKKYRTAHLFPNIESNYFDDLWKKFKKFETKIARAQAQRFRHRQHRSDSRLEVPPLLQSRSRSQSPEPESPGSLRSSSVSLSSSASSSCLQRGRETPPTTSSLAGLPPSLTPSQEPSRYEGEHNRECNVTSNTRPPPAPPGSEPQQPLVAELDDELLQVLGKDPSKANTPGKDIQCNLAVRLQHIATSGLSKETRKELLSKSRPAPPPLPPPPPPPPPPTAPRVPPRAHR
ncbi:zinc finger homeobox protein 4-like [Papilio machaon]|uniref:zinc finger homeobox protein 4-like n=1 Tax=Papilio machaon TaxID=76193 RepID=UPI001E6635FA|nr:zinc finger homeobox protein 4-like [Papilio machaon]